jgi:hypothetical protein
VPLKVSLQRQVRIALSNSLAILLRLDVVAHLEHVVWILARRLARFQEHARSHEQSVDHGRFALSPARSLERSINPGSVALALTGSLVARLWRPTQLGSDALALDGLQACPIFTVVLALDKSRIKSVERPIRPHFQALDERHG